MKKVLLLIIFQCLASFVLAQKDVEFYFAAPTIYKNDTIENEPQKLRITPVGSSDQTQCRIFFPGMGNGSPGYNRSINLGDSWVHTLDIGYMSQPNGVGSFPNTSVYHGALCIQCSDSVNVFFEIGMEGNADIFPLKGKNALGSEFFIPWHNRYANDTTRTSSFYDTLPTPPRNRMDIIVEGETGEARIKITPSVDVYAHPLSTGAIDNYLPAGVEYSFRVPAGFHFSMIAKDYEAGAHLGGTIITAESKNIAVTVSDERLENDNPKTINLVGDQLIPVDKLGKSYIAVKGGQLNDSDKEELYIIATHKDPTEIYLDGTTLVATLQKGEKYTMAFPPGQDAVYFKANFPISVFQNTGIKDYLAGAQLPPIPCYSYDSVGYNRTNEDTLIFNIYVEKRGRGTFAFNGDSTIIKETDFKLVPGTDTLWYYARVGIPNAVLAKDSTVIVSNDIPFHLAVLEGGDMRKDARYGFITKYNQLINLRMQSNKTLFCEGDTLSFWLEDYYNLKNIVWTGPNRLEEHVDSLFLYNVDTTQRGMYHVTAETINLCDKGEDPQSEIFIFDYPVFDLGLDRSHCEGTITFDIAKDSVSGFKYTWSTGNDSTASVTVNAPGEYWVIVDNHTCISTDTVAVTPIFTPTLSISLSGDLCEDLGVVLEGHSTAPPYYWDTTAASQAAQYHWDPGGFGPQITARDTGWHRVEVSYYKNCYATDSIYIAPRVPILQIKESGHLCDKGDTLTADGDGWKFRWNTRDTTQSIVANNPGVYWVTSYINFCESTDTIEILEVIPDVEILQIGGELCRDGIKLDATSEYPGTKFEWNTPDTTKIITANNHGMYYVKVYMNNCVNRDTIEIQEVIPWVDIVKSGDLCRTGVTLDATSEYPGTNFRWSSNGAVVGYDKELHRYDYGTYIVEVSMNNCVNRDTIEIAEETFPLKIDTIGDICKGTLVLEANTEANRFLWNTTDTTQQITTKNFGWYWVEAYLNGCISRDSIELKKQMPDLEITQTNELCRNGYVTLEAVTNANIYIWSTGDTTRQITIDTMGVYSVEVHMNNCVNSDSVNIQEKGPELDIVTEGDLCKNRLLKLKAESDAWEFLWSTGERTQEIDITKSGTYWVVVNINSCYNSDTIELNVEQPIARILPDKIPTEGCEPFEVSFENLSEYAVSYLWDFGDGTKSNNKEVEHTYNSGLYRLAFLAYTAEGCMDSVMLSIQVFSAPTPDFYWEPVYSNVREPGMQFINKTVSGSNENTYLWKFQTDKNNPDAIEFVEDSIDAYYSWSPTGGNLTQGKYKVELVATSVNEGASGEIHYCLDSISYDIRILNDFLQFPNVVTPNGDGINDVFKITSLIDGLAFPNNELQIYDRAGRRIYQKKNIKIESDFWDPKSTNTPPGTYIYHFVGKGFSQDVEYSGTIEVLVK